MNDFTGKVAVVTGAASGIGKGLAEKCVREGMKVVLADIEEPALLRTAGELSALGASAVLPVVTNVAKADQVEALAQKTLSEFGEVHLVFNNAGIALNKPAWEITQNDWDWILGVNLGGVINGVRVFLPILMKQESSSYIVNTSSVNGLTAPPFAAAYNVTKHGILALTESLYTDLLIGGIKNVKVAALCPGFVNTNGYDPERNRPDDLQNPPHEITPQELQRLEFAKRGMLAGMDPADVAEKVFQGLREDKLYILTHPQANPMIQARIDNILNGRNPMPFGGPPPRQ